LNELAYYNEFDAYSAEWLRNLSAADLIAPGVVDERSISDVLPTDLRRFTQCHFFAGIGIWSAALRSAGWPDDRPVWTGSSPCQPFSGAGKRQGFADERHLWPHWFWHIEYQRPNTIFGEQVAGTDEWVDLVRTDLEGIGYTFGCIEIPSAGFGQANIRARTYWVAQSPEFRRRRGNYGDSTGLLGSVQIARRSVIGGVADASYVRRERVGKPASDSKAAARSGPKQDKSVLAELGSVRDHASRLPDRLRHGGDPVEWVYCRDEKWRPIEPGTLPLAPSDSSTVGRLRAYGNAINLRTATEFISAYMECVGIRGEG